MKLFILAKLIITDSGCTVFAKMASVRSALFGVLTYLMVLLGAYIRIEQ